MSDRSVQRVEQVTLAVVAAISKMRMTFSGIDGGHEYVDALMGREGEKRIIRICMNVLSEIGINHKTDRAVRRAIVYKLRSPPIGFTAIDAEP